jgi:ubiquinone/menaquinone biosynthesis C-methylase UbiE
MITEAEAPVEERLSRLLQHLGIKRAHFAGRLARDWTGFAIAHPEMMSSLTLVGPMNIPPDVIDRLKPRLLVINAEHGQTAEGIRRAVEASPRLRLVTLRDYTILGWTDVVAERAEEIGAAMMTFLGETNSLTEHARVAIESEGEIAGISYRIRGAGQPLILLPLCLSPSQWEPLVPTLSARYCTITVGGAELGAAAILEARGRSRAYLHMVRTMIDETELQPGEKVLEVGCGTGVLDRWLAHHTRGKNRIVGGDINQYLLGEAAAFAERAGLQKSIDFREGNAQALPFPADIFDVALSMTVIEEVDADAMLTEMVRVTRRGGRIAVGARAMDMPFIMNLPLSSDLKAKVSAPGAVGLVAERGCADASLYSRLHRLGLTQIKMFPQLAAFGALDAEVLQLMQSSLVPKLSREEAQEWHSALSRAQDAGTLFMAWPHHCAVGTKP